MRSRLTFFRWMLLMILLPSTIIQGVGDVIQMRYLSLGSKLMIKKETSYLQILHWLAHDKPLARDLISIIDDLQVNIIHL